MLAMGWLILHGFPVLAVIAFFIWLMRDKENERTNDGDNSFLGIIYLGCGGWAAYLSWGLNDSIIWAIVHGLLSYFYLAYYYFFR